MSCQIDDEWTQYITQLQETNYLGQSVYPIPTATILSPNQDATASTLKDQERNNGNSNEHVDTQMPLRPVAEIIPDCPVITEKDLRISTRTPKMSMNYSLDINTVFWKVPVIPYWKPMEGVVKKQIKQTIENKEEFTKYEEYKTDLQKNNPDIIFREIVSKHVDNEHARTKKYKDVRKISIGVIKRDIINFKKRDKKAFSNCFAIYLRVKVGDSFTEIHVKVFNTGKMEIPGIHDYSIIETKIQPLLRQLFEPIISDSMSEEEKEQHLAPDIQFEMENNLESKNVLINSDFNCGFYLDKKMVYRTIRSDKYGIDARMVGDYPGIKCKFYFKTDLPFDYALQTGRLDPEDYAQSKKNLAKSTKYIVVTFTFFRTGKCLISGSCSEKMVWFVFHFVRKFLHDEYLAIRSCYEDPVVKNKNPKLRKKIIKMTQEQYIYSHSDRVT